ncbi:VASCULAR-RELATED NAC-DOMAIN 6 [Striga hermonthica]|uniref:VASCULAR-RELATED NAC-DOMAIN 6 n=1 Tax=Striga hermonthica TaxID=68872 RepID=A0A9N7RCX5_STRHE|nr:VASCULAR-RELATED NAC-DOMAIN 6 [Striga hermonthica]
MVSQRQRSARKRFREEHPELFPKPEPPAPNDPNKKKKKNKNSKFKRKKSDPNDPNKPKKPSYKKHPLRVAGMKPGESCYICKAPDHIAKNCPKKSEWERNKICLFCRQRGHSLKNCPNKKDESVDKKFCYNCGEMGHSLARCPQPLQDGGTKYANCFICNESGHLSKNCPKNTHGIYPKGGSCKICGGITHLARDCPNKQSRTSEADMIRQSLEAYERPNRVTKLVSGDDLEDDFVPVAPIEGNDKDVKTKKKQGPKVVNFVG